MVPELKPLQLPLDRTLFGPAFRSEVYQVAETCMSGSIFILFHSTLQLDGLEFKERNSKLQHIHCYVRTWYYFIHIMYERN